MYNQSPSYKKNHQTTHVNLSMVANHVKKVKYTYPLLLVNLN
jgi:hypothetical protein